MTARWSKGRDCKQSYYLYSTKGRCQYGKSVRRDRLHGEFEAIVDGLHAPAWVRGVAEAMFRDAWAQRTAQLKTRRTQLKAALADAERKIGDLVDRIVESGSDVHTRAYEARVQKLEAEKLNAQDQLAQTWHPVRSFDGGLGAALAFLLNPRGFWDSPHFADCRALLKLAFAEPIAKRRNERIGTVEMTSRFKVLGALSTPRSELVGRDGFEPSTKWLKATCSTAELTARSRTSRGLRASQGGGF